MANTMRWRYGETNPVLAAVDASTVVEIGDLLYLDTDDAKPASSQADQGTASLNQEAFQDMFLGVAMQSSASGTADEIRVATTGIFEFECASATYELGALLGVSENSGGNGLENQKVTTALTTARAVGRCVRRVNPANSNVLVGIVSSVIHGGPQALN